MKVNQLLARLESTAARDNGRNLNQVYLLTLLNTIHILGMNLEGMETNGRKDLAIESKF